MMNRSYYEPGELHDLIARLCNEDLDAAGQARLDELLAGDAAAQAWYVEYMDLHAAMRFTMQSLDDEDFTLLEAQAALAATSPTAGEETADSGEAARALPADEHARSTTPGVRQPWLKHLTASPRRWWAAAAAALLVVGAVWLGGDKPPEKIQMAQPAETEPAPPEAAMLGPAKLSGAVGARWAGAALELPEGELFKQDQRLELIEGLAEVTFRCGARVILQGPAVLEIHHDSSARVSVGRIAVVTARVAPAFTIHTAAAQLSSREAEFGADIDFDGSLVTEVYRGEIDLQFSQGAEPATTFQLAGGQGARIDAKSHRVTPLSQPYDLHFVRYLPQHGLLVNLADIVAGGNGVRKAYHQGISLVDGRAVDDYGAPAPGDGRYIRTPTIAFVDGVFIPNGKLGPVQVDSIGRKFVGFPATFGDCWGGAIMARRPREEKSLPYIRLEFHGDNYGYVNWLHIASKAEELSPEGHGLIGMHSNSGITFDLHALRARHPNRKIVRFRAQVGNLESKLERYVADAWVLVDGELRYHREKFSREDGPDSIDVPLSDRDRFLVLAATDVEANTAYDWVAFGDPVIELASVADASAAKEAARSPLQTVSYVKAESDAWNSASPRIARDRFPFQSALMAASQIAARRVNWQLLSSLWNHMERTNLHDMTSLAPAKIVIDRLFVGAVRSHRLIRQF
jgi:hypothetical protein